MGKAYDLSKAGSRSHLPTSDRVWEPREACDIQEHGKVNISVCPLHIKTVSKATVIKSANRIENPIAGPRIKGNFTGPCIKGNLIDDRFVSK